MNFPQVPPHRGLLRADVLNPSISHMFGEAHVETGETVAGGVDDGQHGVITNRVKLEADNIVQPGEQILQQPLFSLLQSYSSISTVTVSRG